MAQDATCERCGGDVAPGDNFCGTCGAPVEHEPAPPPVDAYETFIGTPIPEPGTGGSADDPPEHPGLAPTVIGIRAIRLEDLEPPAPPQAPQPDPVPEPQVQPEHEPDPEPVAEAPPLAPTVIGMPAISMPEPAPAAGPGGADDPDFDPALEAEIEEMRAAARAKELEERLQAEAAAAAEAQRQAEEDEARRQAALAAQRQAEEEAARLEAEEEARLQAEADALRQAEEDARLRAEEEARQAAEAEERARLAAEAEEQARLDAEAAAEAERRAAEEQARLEAQAAAEAEAAALLEAEDVEEPDEAEEPDESDDAPEPTLDEPLPLEDELEPVAVPEPEAEPAPETLWMPALDDDASADASPAPADDARLVEALAPYAAFRAQVDGLDDLLPLAAYDPSGRTADTLRRAGYVLLWAAFDAFVRDTVDALGARHPAALLAAADEGATIGVDELLAMSDGLESLDALRDGLAARELERLRGRLRSARDAIAVLTTTFGLGDAPLPVTYRVDEESRTLDAQAVEALERRRDALVHGAGEAVTSAEIADAEAALAALARTIAERALAGPR